MARSKWIDFVEIFVHVPMIIIGVLCFIGSLFIGLIAFVPFLLVAGVYLVVAIPIWVIRDQLKKRQQP